MKIILVLAFMLSGLFGFEISELADGGTIWNWYQIIAIGIIPIIGFIWRSTISSWIKGLIRKPNIEQDKRLDKLDGDFLHFRDELYTHLAEYKKLELNKLIFKAEQSEKEISEIKADVKEVKKESSESNRLLTKLEETLKHLTVAIEDMKR